MHKKENLNDLNSIQIVYFINKIWNNKILLLKITFIFSIYGIFYSLLSPKEYTASSTFITQISTPRSVGGLSGLASLAGINLENNNITGEIPAILYPKILNSVDVKRSILNIKVPLDSTEITYKDYLLSRPTPYLTSIKNYTIGLPGLILNSLRKNNNITKNLTNPMIVTQEEKSLFDHISNKIIIKLNLQEGFVELSTISDNPNISAELTKKVIEILQNQIIDFKIQHGKEFLKFTQEQYNQKQKEFFNIQDKVAREKDKNKSINSEIYLNQLKQKEGQLLIAQSVYQELAKQLEQAKLQVAKDTPIFSTIEPVTIPTERSAPKRTLIVITFTILGFLISTIYIIIKEPIIAIFKEIK